MTLSCVSKMKTADKRPFRTKDQTTTIKKARIMSLEESLEYLNEDEYCEVTPESIRLRKKILNKNEREKAAKKKNSRNVLITSEFEKVEPERKREGDPLNEVSERLSFLRLFTKWMSIRG